MGSKEEKFLKKLLATFKEEAVEHTKVISTGLFDLEKKPGAEARDNIIEMVFREVHSLKGAARSVNQNDIETMCSALETVFDSLKRRKILLSPGMLELLFQASNFLSELLQSIDSPTNGAEAALRREKISSLKQTLELLVKPAEGEKTGTVQLEKETVLQETILETRELPQHPVKETQTFLTPEKEKLQAEEKIRISTKKLDSLLLQAEELLTTKLAMSERVTELQSMMNSVNLWKREREKVSGLLRQHERRINRVEENNGRKENGSEKLFEFVKWNDTFVKTFERSLTPVIKSAKRDHHSFSSMADNLLEDMKKVLMLPLSFITEIFPKIVRELSHGQNKEVKLIISGEDIEIDRRILEEIRNPLIHLLRNCIDHGIEKPQERLHKKKPAEGTVKIEIAQKDSSKVEIKISDDGAGIDYQKVKASALKLGIISAEEKNKINEEQILPLIFQSGVTTSSIITDLSGRGLGLAIVREKVEKLGGTITVETKVGAGTTFRFVLPLTLATFHGIFVRLNEQLFVIPTSFVEQVTRVKKEEVKSVENKDTIQLHGKVVSLVNLKDALGIPRDGEKEIGSNGILHAVIVADVDKQIAFTADEIIGEQEILVKAFGRQLTRVKNISGTTILGNGKVVPILNVFDLMKSSVNITARVIPTETVKTESVKKHSVMVVEDSITARALLKNILETAGYEVSTAVDGVDAFTQLRTGSFDVVVSDVDMPRMNGFDLTAKIRGEKKFTDLPVVLVTALESREDRERGIDAGANAYIVKSGFDQKNLLEVIKQLI